MHATPKPAALAVVLNGQDACWSGAETNQMRGSGDSPEGASNPVKPYSNVQPESWPKKPMFMPLPSLI